MQINSKILSAALELPVKEGTGRIVVNDNTVTFAYCGEDMWSDINLYELAHLCKERARDKGYILVTHILKNHAVCSIEVINDTPPYVHRKELLNATTEPEVTLLGYAWVMEQKDNK